MAMAEFTHFDNDGNAHMVDVGSKADTKRIAIVKGHIRMQPETLGHDHRWNRQKGRCSGGGAAGWHHGGKTNLKSDSAMPPAWA